MELKDLEYFKAICEYKNISKAARAMYLTPQGLSKIVKNIEEELGTTLLNRSVNGITLTASGEYLYEQLPEFLHTYHHMCNEITCITQRETHEISLLSAYGILRLVTPECLEAFRTAYPHIQLNYREYPDRQVERLFLNGEGNVAFTIGNDALKHVDVTPMEKFEVKAVLNVENPLRDQEEVSLKELAAYPLYIESPEFNLHHMIMNAFEREGLKPKIAFETSGFGLCYKMVSQNKGVSVTTDFVFDDMTNEKVVKKPIKEGPFYWETYMLSRKGEKPNPDVILFCDFVKEWMRRIKAGKIRR